MVTLEVSVEEFAQERAEGRNVHVIDVRERYELENSRLDPHLHIPLAQLPTRIGELDPKLQYVVVCRTGNRSGVATKFLTGQGFMSVRNLVGGMNEWVDKVDPSMKKY